METKKPMDHIMGFCAKTETIKKVRQYRKEQDGKKQKKRKTNKTRIIILVIVLLAVCVGSVWHFNIGKVKVQLQASSTAEIPTQAPDSESKILVAYFTAAENSDVDAMSSASVTVVDGVAKGNVRAIADEIAAYTGGNLFSIQTSVEYSGDIDSLIDYAQDEQDENARPELTTHIENLDQYDTIFIGYPTWWYDLPQVMYSFFDEYDFTGKTVIPFCTSSSSGLGDSGSLLAEEAGTGDWQEGMRFSSGVSESDVTEWVESLNF